MGIKQLSKLIGDYASSAVREHDIKSYFGRKIAVDASMCIYQFMHAVRSGGEGEGLSQLLTNERGEVTSHLQGMFYRTIRMVTNGIKPCFVFDGKPPVLKAGELAKRSANREKAQEELKKAEAEDNKEEMEKLSRRLIKVTQQENDDCKRLLTLMGVPIVQAPCEAEAQCAAMCKAGAVYAVATEDMDALTFGAPVLVRHMTLSEARKEPILEFNLQTVLNELALSQEEFIDLCILCGCDYASTIKGIGPNRALALIKKHRNIETILDNIDKEKHTVNEDFLFAESRELFRVPEVTDPSELKLEWTDPDEDGLIQFLVTEKGFNLERVQGGVRKLREAKGKGSQTRLDSFFTAMPSTSSPLTKRKNKEEDNKKGAKKARGGSAGAKRGRR
eukprot:TRINITY_DN1307_c0_g1_i8.p1 TRINITY_DN1307_c0_g1~~TRINITY_DN1307_c0_g1_i8.p1  ORF type:complete len:431 (-),score=128.07 TRINITY_DN1307_c0_g1_i8:122-1291(-)